MLKPVADDYLRETLKLEPGYSRLHRLVARLFDTHIDDLTEANIIELERLADTWPLPNRKPDTAIDGETER